MGANVHGKQGNQLLDDERWNGYAPEEDNRAPNMGGISPAGNAVKTGLNMSSGKPQFAANDTPAHVAGLDDGADSFFGYKPEDYEDKTSISNSGGGYADFFREQREEEGKAGTNTYVGNKTDITHFTLGDEATMSMDEAKNVLADLVAERDTVQDEGKKNQAIVEFNIFPEEKESYLAEVEKNKKYIDGLNEKIDAVNARLGNKYADYKDNAGGLNTKYFYKSTTISDAELAEEAIANSILKNRNRNQLKVISCGVDDDLSITVGEVDEENRTLGFGDLEKLQDTVLRINEKADMNIPFVGTLMTTFQSVLMEVKDLASSGIQGVTPTEYVTEAGKYITFDVKVYSEVDDKIFTFKYFRYPSGSEHPNSHVYVMD